MIKITLLKDRMIGRLLWRLYSTATAATTNQRRPSLTHDVWKFQEFDFDFVCGSCCAQDDRVSVWGISEWRNHRSTSEGLIVRLRWRVQFPRHDVETSQHWTDAVTYRRTTSCYRVHHLTARWRQTHFHYSCSRMPNTHHTADADATQLSSWVASESAVCIGL